MPVQKINHQQIANELLSEIKSIESSEVDQRQKTVRFKAAAKKYITALYKDGRKYRGTGQEKQISLSTAQKYLSTVRSQVEKLGWRHHLLDRDLSRLRARYPLHSEIIATLEGKDPTETRLLHKSLVEQLDHARDLLQEIYRIDFSVTGTKSLVKRLADRYPLYAGLIEKLADNTNAADAMAVLDKALRERDGLSADLHKLKISHEIMYHLTLPAEDAQSLKRSRSKALTTKKVSVVAVNFEAYITRIANVLMNPAMASDNPGTNAIAPLMFALCAATGRRPIEILIQGDFTAESPYKIRFTGQAKKRFQEERDAERWFYSLVDSQVVIKAIEYLRGMRIVRELACMIPEEGSLKTANKMVNDRTANSLNQYAKEFFGDKSKVFKDTRGIWARIAFSMWFDVDPYWKNKDEDVFYTEMLGQQDANVQMHYKPFKIHGFSRDFKPDSIKIEGRLEKLKALDALMPELARGDAAVRLHNDVKAIIEADPNAKISQSLLISPPISAFRDMAKRYLETCADALGIEKVGSRWKPKSIAFDTPVMIEVEVGEEEVDEAYEVGKPDAESNARGRGRESEIKRKEPAVLVTKNTAMKPKMSSHKNDGGLFVGNIDIGGETVAVATSEISGTDAMKKAWRRYEDDNATCRIKKNGDMWSVEILVFGEVFEAMMMKGRKKAAEDGAWRAFHNR